MTTTTSASKGVSRAKLEQSEFLHFSLEGALPDGRTLVLNRSLGTLSILEVNDHGPHMVSQQQYTASELSVLLPILEAFPYYCPYEALFAHFYSAHGVTDSIIEKAREHLYQAKDDGIWDQEMRSVRNMLSRARLKIRHQGMDIASILETGYILKGYGRGPIVAEARSA